MKFISKFIENLIMLEIYAIGALMGATAAQIHILSPLFMFSIYFGAPVMAALQALQDSDGE